MRWDRLESEEEIESILNWQLFNYHRRKYTRYKEKMGAPLMCDGHSRPVVDVAYSTMTPDGFFLISASKCENLDKETPPLSILLKNLLNNLKLICKISGTTPFTESQAEEASERMPEKNIGCSLYKPCFLTGNAGKISVYGVELSLSCCRTFVVPSRMCISPIHNKKANFLKMAPNPKIKKACAAMKLLGIQEVKDMAALDLWPRPISHTWLIYILCEEKKLRETGLLCLWIIENA